jgi:hypothetical protein
MGTPDVCGDSVEEGGSSNEYSTAISKPLSSGPTVSAATTTNRTNSSLCIHYYGVCATQVSGLPTVQLRQTEVVRRTNKDPHSKVGGAFVE